MPANVFEQTNSDIFFDLCKTQSSANLLCAHSICIGFCVSKCNYEDDDDDDDNDDDDDDDNDDDDDY